MIEKSYLNNSQSVPFKFDRSKVNNLLFLCFGNICRSPFAERYWDKLVDKLVVATPEVTSAGFVAETGRRTPDRFIEILRVFGVDLASHRSKVVTHKMLNTVDAILIMDIKVYDLLKKQFPEHVYKAELLGRFSGKDILEIKDPWSLKNSEAIKSFEYIAQSVEGLLNFFKNNR